MNKEKKSAVRFFAICAAILLVCTFFIWGLQTDYGKVKITRLTLTGPNGTDISTLMYRPNNATDENPAPLAVILHGRSNHAHSNDTWSMELARRGFVVISPDLQGGGESDPSVERILQAIEVTKYANTLSFVEKDKINLIGYSQGTNTVINTYKAVADKVNSICEVFGPFMMKMSLEGDMEANGINTNFCLIKSLADQYDYFFVGDPAANLEFVKEFSGIKDLEINKDFDRNGFKFRYSQFGGTLHQTGNISGQTIKEIISYETSVNDAPVKLDVNDINFLPHQIFSGIACVAMMFMLAALINLLMQNEFFATIATPVYEKGVRNTAKDWVIDILFRVGIPAVLFVPVSAYAMVWFGPGTPALNIFRSTNLNGIMAWLFVVMFIGLGRLYLRNKKRKDVDLSDYALDAAGVKKIDWSKPAKALLMGVIILVFVFTWLWLIEGFLGINYQIWSLSTYLRMSPLRITRSIPYALLIFLFMFTGNMAITKAPSSGNEKKDMAIAIALNVILTAGALVILLLIQYGGSMIVGTGETFIPQIDIYGTGKNTSCGALDFAFGYAYMMGGTTGVVTYIFRKYGNIWAGVIPAALFAGFVTLSGFTLSM
ncbi:hypothetical protein BXO88_06870 [Oribacterium sp. C9]|uniref:alpha/beta hydrolase family protein n=1 Tax=Oribacterium sp. C9 TaxID=1943579 RepID=UPI00098F0BE4|nr:alpha/beta fold hydrolase [Oribacterium sp. C9]OON86708.1 hypothetical protein BXO88_06870 [Oribacterium sp. C9]